MMLTDLNPGFYGAGGKGITRNGQPVPRRGGIGLIFDCPCGCGDRCAIPFENPVDGGPRYYNQGPAWRRDGEDFETMTLHPSIQRVGGCAWHGWIRNGEIVNA